MTPRPKEPETAPPAKARRLRRPWGLLLLGLGAAGCAKDLARPPCDRPDLGGCAVEELELEGNAQVSSGDIEERIATAETAHLLGGAVERVPILSVLDTLTVDYERFDRFVLERDLSRIERYYRARGFYSARVRAARVQRIKDARGDAVRVEIAVVEGEPVEVASVELAWKDWSLEKAQGVIGPITDAKNELAVGGRFEEESYEATKKSILRAMTDRGFAYASVHGHVAVDLVARRAKVTFTVELGPECRFGAITLEGLGELPERPLRAALDIEEGERFSTEALEQAERALADFGVFGSIDVQVRRSPEGKPRDPVVPVVFKVQPAALRSVQLGGGAEVGGRVEAHLVGGWEDRNFLGGLRRFSVEARPGVVFYPLQIGNLFEADLLRFLPELSLRTELRQPAAIEGRTTAVFRGAFKHYRLQTSQIHVAEVDPAGAEPNVVGYQEYAGAAGLERPFLKSDLNVALYYNGQLNDPFSYNYPDPPPGFRRLLITYLEAIVSYDRRRDARGKPDRIDPHKGVYLGADVQVAGYAVGDADDVRIQPEVRAYVPVTKRITLALRLLGGLLFPSNYGDAFSHQDRCDRVVDRPLLVQQVAWRDACEAALQRDLESDLQLLQFRAFFSGGPSSNRGYSYNEVGPHGAVPSLTGGQAEGLVPTGGLSLWESSVELRIPLTGNLGTAVFVDASDVTRDVAGFRLTRPHLSTGFGLRYATPVGPLRVDVGYRIPCLQVLGVCPGEPLPSDEGTPSTVLGLPIAVNIAIGEAF